MADTKTVAPNQGPGTKFWNWLTETQVWTSVFRHDRPDTDRNRVLVMIQWTWLYLTFQRGARLIPPDEQSERVEAAMMGR